MSELTVTRDVSDKERRHKTLIAASLTAVSGGCGAFAVPHMDDNGLLWALFAAYMCLCIVYTYKCWTTRQVHEPSPAVLEARQAREEEELRKQREFESKWYFRYPMAALMAGGGIYLMVERERIWWLGAVLCFVALLQAWEVVLVALLVGAVYLLFKGVAALPVSVAVIIGAAIIALAIRRRTT